MAKDTREACTPRNNAEYVLLKLPVLMADLRIRRDWYLACANTEQPDRQVEILAHKREIESRERFLKKALETVFTATFPRERQMLTMRYVGGIDRYSIAQQLGVQVHAVDRRIDKALVRIEQRSDIGELAIEVRRRVRNYETFVLCRLQELQPKVVYKITD